ncbi:MAG: hypothetical protein ACYDG2_22015 [Ruminiclostridium sp.]
MTGKKNVAVVSVIDGLTPIQAANIQNDIVKSKNKHAPNARGIATLGDRKDIGKMLNQGQASTKLIEASEVKVVAKKKKR